MNMKELIISKGHYDIIIKVPIWLSKYQYDYQSTNMITKVPIW
jgi:hypothetical protein